MQIVSSTCRTFQPCDTRSPASRSSRSALHGGVRRLSTGCTMPRPMSRCQRRLVSVRDSQPLSGFVMISASCASRPAGGSEASICPRSGKIHAGVAITPVALSQRASSNDCSEAIAARSYVCRSVQRSTKLSWQLAHLRLMPRNVWPTFWANWIGTVWLAFTVPRQTIPSTKPRDSSAGETSSRTNRSNGTLAASERCSQVVICRRPPVMKPVPV